jgi:formylglycine-generating enzyme required for sulfatase activity
MAFITLKGINDAVSNLAPRPGTLQDRLLCTLSSYFSTEESLKEITSISSDELVKILWNVDSQKEIRKKKKNLSSLKSATNKRLKELTDLGQNPEGLTIGKDNVFTISEEHKNSLLNKLGISSGSDPALDFLASMRGLMGDLAEGGDSSQLQAMLSELDKTRGIIDKLLQEKGESPGSSPSPSKEGEGEDGQEDIEEIELGEGEELVVVKRQHGDGTEAGPEPGEDSGDAAEGIEHEQAAETGQLGDGGPGSVHQDIEIPEEEHVEEILDNEVEQKILDEEDVDLEELVEEGDLLEVTEKDIVEEEIEEVEDLLKEGDEFSDDLGGDAGGGKETGASTLPGGIEGGAGPGEGRDVSGLGKDTGTGQLGDGGPGSGQQDIEILEEEHVEKIIDDEVEQEILDEEDVDLEELVEEEDFLEVSEEDIVEEEIEEVEDLLKEGDEFSDDLGGDAGGGKETGASTLPGGIEGDAGPGEGRDVSGLGKDTGTGQLGDRGPGSGQQDIEILGDEHVEEIIDDEVEQEELIDDEELLEVTEEDIAEVEEADIVEVDEEDLIEQDDEIREGTSFSKEDSEGVGEGGPSLSGAGDETEKANEPSDRPLEMSRYIEPSEALENLPNTLNESNDEFLSMIMQRFMPPFIQIPSGNYRVGCKKPKSMDRPAQNVLLKKYHISQIPVTNDVFDFFIRETGYETDAEKIGYGTVVEGRFSQKIDPETSRASLIINPGVRFQHVEGANWRHPKGPHSSLENKASHPVVQISRRDAIAFASWAGKKLPSEDEWEVAARGNAGHLFPWGEEWLDTYGNFESSQIGDTTPVTHYGKEAMSPFGLLDMLGNVLEWTFSRPHDAIDDGTPPRISILKGGSWATGGIITAATRFVEGDDTWSNIIGFRCAV